MQIKNFPSFNRTHLLAIRLAVLGGSLYFIFTHVLLEKPAFSFENLPENSRMAILSVSILMIVNWALEGLRWKLSLASHQLISFSEAMSTVLAGLAMNWMFPFTTGDVLARLAPSKDRYQTTSAIALNRGIMLFMTLVFGGYGAWTYSSTFFSIEWSAVMVVFAVILLLITLRSKARRFLVYFQSIDIGTLSIIIGLSIVRYSVFTLQFFILLKVFMHHVSSLIIFGGIGWIFLVRSFLPSLLGGIGLREASGILYFSNVVQDLSLVVIPIFLLWFINIVIPSLAGLLGFLKLRAFAKSAV